MRLVVTGGSGYLGDFACRRAAELGHGLLSISRRVHDGGTKHCGRLLPLSDGCDFDHARIQSFEPDGILHMAAISSAEYCEKNGDEARIVNVELTRRLVEVARAVACPILYVSTDLVFDGVKAPPGGFPADASPAPRSVYAHSKREGELATLAYEAGSVARLSLLYGPPAALKAGPLRWMVEKFTAGEKVALFFDEWRTPLHVEDAARALLELVASGERGIFHLGGPERVSRVEFGMQLARAFGFDEHLIMQTGRAASASLPARPEDVSLDSRKISALLSFAPCGVAEGMRRTHTAMK